MPDACRARSLVRKEKSTRVSHHRLVATIRHSLRDGFTVSLVLSPAIRLIVTVTSAMRKHCRLLDFSVEKSGPHDLAVRLLAHSSLTQQASIASRAQRP
jgi:hypothetical protein